METDSPESATHQKRPLVIHPFVLAVFPVLSLYSASVGEALLRELCVPIALALVLAGALYFALYPILRDPPKRGIAVSLFWLAFYAFVPIVDALRDTLGLESSVNTIQLLAASLTGLGGCTALFLWLRKTPRTFTALTSFLNTLALIAVIIPAGLTAYRTAGLYRSADEIPPATGGVDPTTYPDIYFLIYDAYTREDYLLDAFNYDNAPFLDGLRERGFYIADKSRSNYMFTQMSLAATLNYAYIEEDLLDNVAENWNAAVPRLAGRIWNNDVVAFLKARGYEVVTFPSYVAATRFAKADRHFKAETAGWLTEFHRALIDRSPLRSVWFRLDAPRIFPFFFPLDAIEALQRGQKPMFVFAHIMAPHLPHTVDSKGDRYAKPPAYHEGYRNEVSYLNKRTLEIVDAVLVRRPNSIFIIQGDHGPWSDWDGNTEGRQDLWQGTPEDYLRDRTAILNAIYFPSRDYGALYPEITPVNTFRVLFNAHFGAGFPVLEDKTYLYTEDASSYRVIVD